MEDCLTLGTRLKNEEKQASEERIENALLRGNDKLWDIGITARQLVADRLYSAQYDGPLGKELPNIQEVMDTFCWDIFGADFQEVLKAWDKYLG
ncbi:hypothetical protein LCGC14_0480960 [marine sediment metagenome]|uniref:Uncharacterized protein n=1 Tax=marine sediment metagenome TaxID=412755 RepID=A0A0F9SSI8_9ZZZZ